MLGSEDHFNYLSCSIKNFPQTAQILGLAEKTSVTWDMFNLPKKKEKRKPVQCGVKI